MGYNKFNQEVTYSVNGQKYILNSNNNNNNNNDNNNTCDNSVDYLPNTHNYDEIILDENKCKCDYMELDVLDKRDFRRLNLQLESLYVNAGIYIDTLLQQYIRGEILTVKETLNTDFYNRISISLYDEKCERFEYYEYLRLIMNKSLEVIEQSINLEAEMENKLNKLKNEIEAMKNPARPIFELEQEIETVAQIRPEYVKYIQLYGLPEGGIFDPDKLAISINLLNQ